MRVIEYKNSKRFFVFLRIFFFAVSFLLCIVPQYAGSAWKVGNTLHGRGINTLKFLDVNTVVVAGGSETNDSLNSVIKYTDRGETLIQYYDFSEIRPWFTDMSFPSHDTGYLVGWNGQMLKTTTAAESWQYKSLPAAVAHRHYNGVYFTSNLTGYMAGGNRENDTIQTILKTTNGADTWNVIRDIPGQWLNSVYFISANTGFCVGAVGTVLKTTNAGNSWSRINVGGDAGTRNFTKILFINSNIGFIIGGSEKESNVQTILKTENGGNDWTVLKDSIGGQMLNGIGFMDADTGFAVGNLGAIKKTTDGGATWLDFYLPEDINDAFRDLKAVDFFKNYGGAFGGEIGKFILYEDSIPLGAAVRTDSIIRNTDKSVRIFGQVNPNGSATHAYFEYGRTLSMGNRISVAPDSLYGNSPVSISAATPPLSPGTYYCRLRGVNRFGDSSGNVLIFKMDIPGVYTGGAAINSDNSVKLQGIVNPNGFGAHVIFEYGETEALGNRIDVIPDSVYGNADMVVSATTPVMPIGLYHYRIRAYNSGGDSAGNILQFRIGVPEVVTGNVTTGDIVIYSDNRVKLTGWVNPRGNLLHPVFEYGLTPALGNSLDAIPDSVSGNAFRSVYAMSPVLSPGIYYYRLHVVYDGGDTSGGIRQFYIGDNPIPNFDFEEWESRSDTILSGGWLSSNSFLNRPVRKGISYDGSTSMVLTGDNTKDGFSMILLGVVNDPGNGLSGGAPLNARPDSLVGHFRYNLRQGHPASWGYVLKKNGIYLTPPLPSPPYIQTIPADSSGPYTTNGEFVRLAFPVVYPDAFTVPDTIILGFLSNDLNIMFDTTGEVAPENVLELDNLSYTGTSQTIPNSGFEDWKINSLEHPASWITTDMESATYDGVLLQVLKTTDARNGLYAVRIQNNLNSVKGRMLLSGTIDPLIKPAFPIPYKFKGLYGYYKFYPDLNSNDTAVIYVTMFKNSELIGNGQLQITNPMNTYYPFYDSIIYSFSDSIFPDSANIGIYFINRSQTVSGNAVFFLDDLRFDGLHDTAFVISGIQQVITPSQTLRLFPNPVAEVVAFTLPAPEKLVSVECLDIRGNIYPIIPVSNSYKDLNMFNVNNLPDAIYFLRIQTEQGVYSGKFLKISQ
ncbi:MAG: T9SS type A sorting domain-containing protein [Sphingobacteriales bacterium]|nr:T9SS type A sorting domain-containing protein [Sphingobacteriales bacterium]